MNYNLFRQIMSVLVMLGHKNNTALVNFDTISFNDM